MFIIPRRLLPSLPIEETLIDPGRRLGPPVPIITVTRGVDPRAERDPASLNDASPYFSTSSEAPRT